MSVIMSKRLKTALVLLCTMLIFFQLIPDYKPLRVYAAQSNDEYDEEEYEIDDDEYDEDDGDIIIIEDDDEDDDEEPVTNQVETAQQKQNQAQTVSSQNEKKQEKDETQSVKKTRGKHKKLTVDVVKKRSYNDKLSVGDELKITVKAKNKKIKNKVLKFSSGKNSVASVSADGVITARKNGTARIKIVNKKKKSQKCFIIITVTKK